jgi:RES domain-containing protein
VPHDVDPAPVRGVWFRHVPAAGEPLYRPERPADGRWQRGEVVEGFYLADSEDTVWAEWYRALAEFALPPLRQIPRDLWRFEVEVDRAADLSSPERLERVKLMSPVPDRRQWPSYQAVGETLFAEGWAGVLYPAAARPDSLALCLFRTSDQLAGVRPQSPPLRVDEPPAPPRGLRA